MFLLPVTLATQKQRGYMALFNRNRGQEKAEMSFIDHLEELRQHIVRSIIAILVMAIVIFIYRDWVFDNIITGPINPNFISYKALCDLVIGHIWAMHCVCHR